MTSYRNMILKILELIVFDSGSKIKMSKFILIGINYTDDRASVFVYIIYY